MNNKGQALIEFVLILPVFLFLLFAIYDFGRIFNEKNILLNESNDIVNLYKDGKSVDEIEDIYSNVVISITEDDSYDKLLITNNIKLITPGFNRIFGNPYKIEVERYIPNE